MLLFSVVSGFVLSLKAPVPWLRRRRREQRILATVSHELRTPLNAILGCVNLLKSGTMGSDGTRHALECIERNVRIQTRLVDELLDAAPNPQGRKPIVRTTIDMRQPIDAAVERMQEAARARRVALEARLSGDPLLVCGDAGWLEEIAAHLIANAIKFTPAGGRVSVELEPQGTCASLRVTDTGEGISADDLPHVFEPFYQGASSGRRMGLGLGLSIVRRRVAEHGGTLSAHSGGKGHGAVFRVALPLLARTARRPRAPHGFRPVAR